MEFYNQHRPDTLDRIAGQPEAVSLLKTLFSGKKAPPRTFLLSGPSGCGKTTIARIMATLMDCRGRDYVEYNASDAKGIDTIRKIRRTAELNPMYGGKRRIFYIDEAHGLTGDAQNAVLKLLEEPPEKCAFILATTDPAKLIGTIKTRCTHITLKSLSPADLREVVADVCKREKRKPPAPDVMDRLLDVAGGSARQLLVDYQKVCDLKTSEEQIRALAPPEVQATAMSIVNALLPFKGQGNLKEAINAIDTCQDDLEKVRRIVLSCCVGAFKRNSAHRAYLVVCAFAEPFFHSGKAGMIAACYQVFNAK